MAKLTLASVDALRTLSLMTLPATRPWPASPTPLHCACRCANWWKHSTATCRPNSKWRRWPMLRRDQKYAPVGRPSVHIVQLRKQQAATKQAALIGRQVVAQAAQTRAGERMTVKAKQSPSEACVAWLGALR